MKNMPPVLGKGHSISTELSELKTKAPGIEIEIWYGMKPCSIREHPLLHYKCAGRLHVAFIEIVL